MERSLNTDSYRSTTEVNSNTNISSVSFEENFDLEDTEVSQTDLELGSKESLAKLSLLTKYKCNKISKARSTGNLSTKRTTDNRNWFNSHPNMVELFKKGKVIKKLRQNEIFSNEEKLAIVPYIPKVTNNNIST